MKRFHSSAGWRGFTLVELSLVLIIIALLMGVTLVGHSLIKSAELRTMTARFTSYRIAIRAFQEKYNYLPGDLPTATSYWPADTQCAVATAPYRSSSTSATCNGDGDGLITATAASIEWYRLPQHLANGGLIQGGYSGRSSNKSPNATTGLVEVQGGLDMPSLPRNGVLFAYTLAEVTSTADTNRYEGTYNGVIEVTKPTSNNYPYDPLFTTTEAFDFDTKMDDGKPGTGNVVSWKPAHGWPCATTASSNSALYNFALSGLQCELMVRNQF